MPAPPSSVSALPSSSAPLSAADQDVVPGAADQGVAAAIADEIVRGRAAGEPVGHAVLPSSVLAKAAAPTTFSMLVIVSVPPDVPVFWAVSGVEVDRHRRGGGGVVDRVRPARAVIGVGAAAFEEDVVVAVAGDVVGAGAGADVLEAGDGVAAQPVFWAVSVARLTVTAVAPREGQRVHAHAAVEGVVAEAALDDVGVGVAGQGVGARAAEQVLDAAQGGDRHAADGGGRVRRAVQRGRDAGAQTREGRGVGPGAAVQQVHGAGRVRARIERVVARAAREGVGVGVAREAVVEAGAQQVLEPAERVRARIDRCSAPSPARPRLTVTPAVAPA